MKRYMGRKNKAWNRTKGELFVHVASADFTKVISPKRCKNYNRRSKYFHKKTFSSHFATANLTSNFQEIAFKKSKWYLKLGSRWERT